MNEIIINVIYDAVYLLIGVISVIILGILANKYYNLKKLNDKFDGL